jgi:hypothetical protein
MSFIVARLILFLLFPLFAHILTDIGESKVPAVDAMVNLTYGDIIDILAKTIFGEKWNQNKFEMTSVLEKRLDGLVVSYALSFLIFCVIYCGILYGLILIGTFIIGILFIFYMDLSYKIKSKSDTESVPSGLTGTKESFPGFP